MHKYWGYGLNITSDIEFPELLPSEFDSPDVRFIINKTPENIEGLEYSTKLFSHIINDNELLFTVPDTARYHASNGNKILIEPFETAKDSRSVRLYVLATAMAAILLQRNLLPLHASAILHNNELVFITGDSGAGKSTMLAKLINNGHTLFSDDVVVLNKKEDSTITATASYPMIKLWNETLEMLNDKQFSNRSFRIRHDLDKFGFFFHDTFNTSDYPIKKIFILKKHDGSEIISRKLTGGEAFQELTKQVYRAILMHNNSLRLLSFKLLSELTKGSVIYEIKRPMECEAEELAMKIEKML